MSDQFDAIYKSPKELAGPHYDEMMRSKAAALNFLSASDYAARAAAILICENTWNCRDDPRLWRACYETANSDAHDSFRICAIDCLGRSLTSTKSEDVSQYLAMLVADLRNGTEVRIAAYWALREIQLGSDDPDSFRRHIHLVKLILRDHPGRFVEDEVEFNLLGGQMCDPIWDNDAYIDWNYVKQFLPIGEQQTQPKIETGGAPNEG